MGKSRVTSAIAHQFLKNTNLPVYLVFSDEGLLKRDYEQCKDLWFYTGMINKNNNEKLHHVVGVDSLPQKKNCIVVIDESDDVMMRDIQNFAKKTMSLNMRIICLTATPDDGLESGLERRLMNLMSYNLIRAQKTHELTLPKV